MISSNDLFDAAAAIITVIKINEIKFSLIIIYERGFNVNF